MSIEKELNSITRAMQEDGLEPGSLSYTCFCNIKMPIYDGILATISGEPSEQVYQEVSKLSAKIANQLMLHLFDITTNYE